MDFLCLKMKAVATFWDVEKIKQMEEWQVEYLAPKSHAAKAINRRDHDQRAEHRQRRHYDSNVTTQGTVYTLRTQGKLQQNVRNRMVLTYNDGGSNRKCPQIGVLLNKRATKRAPFLLFKFRVR